VDCQSQTFDLLEAFYKETVEALINVDRNTELSKDNEAKNFKRIKKVLGERFQEVTFLYRQKLLKACFSKSLHFYLHQTI